MTQTRIEYKLLKFVESIGPHHSQLESFQGLLGVALNLYMSELNDDRTDPLTVMTAIIKEGLTHYEKNAELHFGPNPGDG